MSDAASLAVGGQLDRRRLLTLAGSGLVLASLAACGKKAAPVAAPALIPERDDAEELPPKEARKRLQEGNERFVLGKSQHPDQSLTRRKALGEGQAPFAAVLSCADSRVPPEVVFDQGLGDLFVVRSAGQVLDDAVLGSLQFGVGELKTPLLVVLGHSGCGAIKATIEAVTKKSPPSGTGIDALVAALKPAVKDAEEGGAEGEEALVAAAVANNVDNVVEQLKTAKVIENAIKAGKLRIQGAIYEIDTGEVIFS
jgi:carbonic anhydrase